MSNLPDGCTNADIDRYWGTEEQQEKAQRMQDNINYVNECRKELYAVIDKYVRPQGLLIGTKDTNHAKDCIDDVVTDLFYNFLKEQ